LGGELNATDASVRSTLCFYTERKLVGMQSKPPQEAMSCQENGFVVVVVVAVASRWEINPASIIVINDDHDHHKFFDLRPSSQMNRSYWPLDNLVDIKSAICIFKREFRKSNY